MQLAVGVYVFVFEIKLVAYFMTAFSRFSQWRARTFVVGVADEFLLVKR
jgi:hypothetical protein